MKDKKIIVLIILGIGAVISLIYGIGAPSGMKRAPAVGDLTGIKPVPSERALVIIPRKQARTSFLSWERNPFIPVKDAAESLILEGIIWNEQVPKAIISGEIVAVGDFVEGSKIIAIEKDKVILGEGEKQFELNLE